jgi:hypothetical protein
MTTRSSSTQTKPDLYDGPRLMAAVEAVLTLHVPFERQMRQFCGVHNSGAKFRPSWERAVSRCPDCREVTKRVCAACGPICNDIAWPCATVLAIRTALAAEAD